MSCISFGELLMSRIDNIFLLFMISTSLFKNVIARQVEDMLKRSFAEFHAQKAQPESLLAMEKGQAALAKIRAKSFPQAFMGTTRDDIRQYHYISQDIDDLSLELQVRPAICDAFCRLWYFQAVCCGDPQRDL